MARIATFGAVVAASALVAAVAAPESQAERRIYTNGRPLAEQLRHSDRRIVLPINAAPPNFAAPPRGVTRERFWTDECPFVAVLLVQSVRHNLVYRDDMDIEALTAGTLTQRNAPASDDKANWVISSIRARLESVLKGGPALKEGDEIVFEEDGGTAMLSGVEIVATVPWQGPLSSGKRYLVFGSITDDGRLLRTAAYEEPSPFAQIVGVGPQVKGDRLESFNVEQVLFHLQQEMSRQ